MIKTIAMSFPRTSLAVPESVRKAYGAFFSDCRHTPRYSMKGIRTVGYTERVYDGDTVQIVIEPIAERQQAYRYSCRLANINAPEIGHRAKTEEEGKAAVASRDFLKGLVWGQWIGVDVHGHEKYGRLLVDLWLLDGDMEMTTHVNRLMVEEGHARVY